MNTAEIVPQINNLIDLYFDRNTDDVQKDLIERTLIRICRELTPFSVGPYNKLDKIPRNVTKLNIGSGSQPLEGFLNIDIVGTPDLLWDVRTGLPFDTDSLDFILSEHFLEHIDRENSVPFVLQEMFRVLKNGSSIIIGVPDTYGAARAILENDKQTADHLYASYLKREQASKTSFFHFDLVCLLSHDFYADKTYNPHFWGYSEESLTELMKQAGFSNIVRLQSPTSNINPGRFNRSIYLEGQKEGDDNSTL